tara:strand:+ start:798 stop:1529 length:732 start_codon:yes stop_codon:yes gene_type:complete
MKHKLGIFIILIVSLCNCKSQKQPFTYTTDTLKLIPVSENAFIHISYLNTTDFGKVACNGLVYINNNEAIVFDTPTSSEVSIELIKWITETKKCDITAVVINHFHEDCLGGLEAFHQLDIPSFANNKTIALAQKNNFTIPQIGFDNEIHLKVGTEKVINRFFGEAHTQDNIVSYIPNENLLFGGCMVKALNASKGFIDDANINEWGNTIAKIKTAYPNLKIVIPGHGTSNGTELLDYTIQLFK